MIHPKRVVNNSNLPSGWEKALPPLIHGWLKASIVDQGQTLFPETSVPQGGVISPLLMNIALHDLREDLLKAYPKRHHPAIIRFADDVVIVHHNCQTLQQLATQAQCWLNQVGLQLNPAKTYLCHTLVIDRPILYQVVNMRAAFGTPFTTSRVTGRI